MNNHRCLPIWRWILAVIIGLSGVSPAASAAEPDLSGSIQPPVHQTEPAAVIAPAPTIPQAAPQPSGQVASDILAWDADQKENNTVMGGDPNVPFTFNVTNVSSGEVTIFSVATSCGCTTARLPPMPWKLAPGAHGEIGANLNVAGKNGTVIKTITVHSDKGNKTLLVKANITQPPATNPEMGERERNQQLALADPQAIFKGDCARCHVEPGVGKMGKELYTAVCGVCHEAEHRASMVADLHNPKQEVSRDLWRVWVTYGKPGTLMPGFSKAVGGPLSNEQIDTLIDYMAETLPMKPVATNATPAAH